MGIASKNLQSELKKRFKRYTDPSADQHEHIFILGTALDPRYRLLLNPVQMSAAKSQLLKEVCFNYNIVVLLGPIHYHVCMYMFVGEKIAFCGYICFALPNCHINPSVYS